MQQVIRHHADELRVGGHPVPVKGGGEQRGKQLPVSRFPCAQDGEAEVAVKGGTGTAEQLHNTGINGLRQAVNCLRMGKGILEDLKAAAVADVLWVHADGTKCGGRGRALR